MAGLPTLEAVALGAAAAAPCRPSWCAARQRDILPGKLAAAASTCTPVNTQLISPMQATAHNSHVMLTMCAEHVNQQSHQDLQLKHWP